MFDEDPRENDCPSCNEYEKERLRLIAELEELKKDKASNDKYYLESFEKIGKLEKENKKILKMGEISLVIGERNLVLNAELEQLKETHNIRLAGISVLSNCNTEKALKEQTQYPRSPYWTPAFCDVKTAMEREIKLIAENENLCEALNKSTDFVTKQAKDFEAILGDYIKIKGVK